MKHILIIGSIPLVPRKIKDYKNVRLTLMTKSEEISEQDLNCFEQIITLPKSASEEEWIQGALYIQKIRKIDFIGCFDEMNQYITSIIAENLNIEFHTKTLIEQTRDKYLMRKRLHELGIDNTPFKIADSIDDIKNFSDLYGYPIILKPQNGWASVGVSIIRSENDIPAGIEWFKEHSKEEKFYLEKFLYGQEYSVEAFSENGEHKIICITKQFNNNDHMIEVGHVIPAQLAKNDEKAICNLVINVLNGLEVQNGPTHTELILTKNGPIIVETHTRLAGDLIPDLIQIGSGLDLYSLWAKQLLGESIIKEIDYIKFEKYSSIWFKTLNVEGVLKEVLKVDEVRNTNSVERVYAWKSGTKLTGLKNSFSRPAYVISSNEKEETAINIAKKGIECLKFLVEH